MPCQIIVKLVTQGKNKALPYGCRSFERLVISVEERLSVRMVIIHAVMKSTVGLYVGNAVVLYG